MFYRLKDDNTLDTAGVISTPDYELSVDTKDNFTYPKDEWYWFDTESKAKSFFDIGPQVVSMRQARLALLQQDLLDQVEAAVAAMPAPEGKAARITWEYAGEVRRGDALVQGLAQSFGWTDQQLDALFELAAQL